MARSKRYYLGERDSKGVTPSQLTRLGKQKQLAYMREWFNKHFESPVQRTSWYKYESIYRWGEPYNASQELVYEFGSGVNANLIQDLITELESSGIKEWAPTIHLPRRHYPIGGAYDLGDEIDPVGDDDDSEPPNFVAIIKDIENGRIARFGNASEQRSRKALYDQLLALEKQVRDLKLAARGIGDNFPPPDDDQDVTDASQVSALNVTMKDLQQELLKVEPNTLRAAQIGLKLSKTGIWLKERLSKGSEKWVEGLIIATPSLLLNEGLWHSVNNVAVKLGEWLSEVLKIL